MRINIVNQRRTTVLRLVEGERRESGFATVVRGLGVDELTYIETLFSALRSELTSEQPDFEHGHWDWQNKIDAVNRGRQIIIGVEYDHEFQGLLAMQSNTATSKIDSQPLIYVDFLEVAPWNLERFAFNRRTDFLVRRLSRGTDWEVRPTIGRKSL